MANRKGLTLIEITVVLIVIGVLTAVSVPYYTAYTQQGAASAALNNLTTIYGAQNNYYMNNNSSYYISSGSNDLPGINTALLLSLVDPGFQYTCSATAAQNPQRSTGFTCTAKDSYFTLQLTDAQLAPNNVNPACAALGSASCPG